MDSEKIDSILHRSPIQTYYKARIGDVVNIELPRIPLTRYTEHVRLLADTSDSKPLEVEGAEPFAGEGHVDPSSIRGVAVSPGTARVIVRAVDSVSGEALPGVRPIDITVEVLPSKDE